jgi:hypothetical protein
VNHKNPDFYLTYPLDFKFLLPGTPILAVKRRRRREVTLACYVTRTNLDVLDG